MRHEAFIASALVIALFLCYVSTAAEDVAWMRRTIAVVAAAFFAMAVIASAIFMVQVVRS